jgi:hypothetical protein
LQNGQGRQFGRARRVGFRPARLQTKRDCKSEDTNRRHHQPSDARGKTANCVKFAAKDESPVKTE